MLLLFIVGFLVGGARGDVPPLDEVLRVLVLQVHAEPGDFYPPLSSSEAFLLECFCEWGWSGLQWASF